MSTSGVIINEWCPYYHQDSYCEVHSGCTWLDGRCQSSGFIGDVFTTYFVIFLGVMYAWLIISLSLAWYFAQKEQIYAANKCELDALRLLREQQPSVHTYSLFICGLSVLCSIAFVRMQLHSPGTLLLAIMQIVSQLSYYLVFVGPLNTNKAFSQAFFVQIFLYPALCVAVAIVWTPYGELWILGAQFCITMIAALQYIFLARGIILRLWAGSALVVAVGLLFVKYNGYALVSTWIHIWCLLDLMRAIYGRARSFYRSYEICEKNRPY